MNSNSDDFETLRQLMALKRHEQPSQEYLNQLHGTIKSRIERGDGQLSLFERVSANFAVRPTLAYALGLTVCGGLGMSAVYMVNQEMARSASVSDAVAVSIPTPPPTAAYASQNNPQQLQLHVANWLRNTNPAAETQPEVSYFDINHNIRQVSYEGGN